MKFEILANCTCYTDSLEEAFRTAAFILHADSESLYITLKNDQNQSICSFFVSIDDKGNLFIPAEFNTPKEFQLMIEGIMKCTVDEITTL